MVQFNTDYWNGMEEKPLEKLDLRAKDVGISMGIGDPWVNLKTAVTAGASHVELGFMGVGKGSISQPTTVTPGAIGKEVLALCKCLGMRTMATGKRDLGSRGIDTEIVPLEELLARSDFVSLHVPLDDSTIHMMDLQKMRLMKQTAYLIGLAPIDNG